MAKKDGIFDDATIEISEMTVVLKTDRDRIESMLELLSVKAEQYGTSDHARRHAESIIKTLQMRLGDATQEFTKALELRARTMQLQQKKRAAFTGPQISFDSSSGGAGARGGGGAGDGSGDAVLNMGDLGGSDSGGQYMQQELLDLDPQVQQLRAIEDIQKTLIQLGQMFSQFSVLVQRQGEQIERIDDQVEQTQSNIQRAQEELLKFYQNMSGNRSLIMKLFGVTAGFLVVFVMFFL